MTPSRFLVAGAGAFALVLAAGCTSSGTPSIGATPSASPPVRASGPLADPDSPERVVYDERLVSDPLPASSARRARGSTSAEEAVAAATQVGRSAELQPGTPITSLRMVYPGKPDGATKVAGTPSWVLTWRNSEPAVRGPVDMTDAERRAIADSLTCVYVVTVDAATTKPTNSVQFCEKK